MLTLIKRRVKCNNFDTTGTITKSHRIRITGRMETVYEVMWDGNPTSVPMMWRDECGSSKRGYRKNQLTLV